MSKGCPTPQDLAAEYAEHLKALNRSAYTVRHYAMSLARFLRFLEQAAVSDLSEVTPALLAQYQQHQRSALDSHARPNSVPVQNLHVMVVKSFFRYLRKRDYLPLNPAEQLEYAKEPQRLPRDVLSESETARLLSLPDTSTLLGYRDRAILELLYSTGIRRAELLGLQPQDVNLEDGLVRVKGKGAKDRVVPVGQLAAHYLQTYISGIRPELLARCRNRGIKALFISHKGGALGKQGLRWLVQRYARQAGLKTHVTPHTFRHSCATHMVRNHAGIRHVQELLGHRSLNTTQQYLRLTITDLKEAHAQFHPRGRVLP